MYIKHMYTYVYKKYEESLIKIYIVIKIYINDRSIILEKHST